MRLTSAGRNLRWPLLAAFLAASAAAAGTAIFSDRGAPFSAGGSAALRSVAVDSPLSAEFALANGRLVRLDYLDGENFRLADGASAIETLVVDGQIYLHFLQRDSQLEQVWYYAELAPAPLSSVAPPKIALRPTLIPPQGIALWGDVGQVFDVDVRLSGPLGTPSEATVAKLPALANAQWKIATRLLPAMDMTLCGDGVQQLTSWWDPALARDGWAILATSAGVRLNGSIARLSETPGLPAGIEVRSLPTADDR